MKSISTIAATIAVILAIAGFAAGRVTATVTVPTDCATMTVNDGKLWCVRNNGLHSTIAKVAQ